MDLSPALETSAAHVALALAWTLPARRCMPGLHPAGWFAGGYLLGATLLIVLHHAVALLQLPSSPLVFIAWGGLWLLLMWRLPAPRSPIFRRRLALPECLGVALVSLAGLSLRLVDPLRHASLAGGDSYVLLQYVHRFMERGVVFHEYIAGLPVLLGSLRWSATPFEVLHVAPAVVASMGIPAIFALGCRMGGRATGWLAALVLAAGPLYVNVASFHIVFAQFTTLVPGLVFLLIGMPRVVRESVPARAWLLAACPWIFLLLTGTYFALILAVITGAWLLVLWLGGRLPFRRFLAAGLLPALVPGWIAFHYAVAVPRLHPELEANFTTQVGEFETLAQAVDANAEQAAPNDAKAIAPGTRVPPALRAGWLFAGPKRWDGRRGSPVETLALWGVGILALPLLRKPASTRGFAGVTLLFSLACTVTGMFEMPGYQGRYLFLMGLLAIPSLVGLALSIPLLRRRRREFRRRGERLLCGAVAASCLYSLVHPPIAGETIPTGADIPIRRAPEDDLLTRLALATPPDVRLRLIFLHGRSPIAGAGVSGLNMKESITGLAFEHLRHPEKPGAAKSPPSQEGFLVAVNRADLEAGAVSLDGLAGGREPSVVFRSGRMVLFALGPVRLPANWP